MRDPTLLWVAASPPLQQNVVAGIHEATVGMKGTETRSILLCFPPLHTCPFIFFNEWERESVAPQILIVLF
jgi:hypothetical protein